MDGRGIFNPHRHHKPFVQAPGGIDGHQRHIVRVYLSLEEAIGHIQSSPDFPFGAVCKDVVNPLYWETVCDCMCI